MKTFSPRQLAIYLSVIIAIISGAFQLIIYYIDRVHQLKFVIISVLSIFILCYILLFFIIKIFIINKIKPIYKTIHSHTTAAKKTAEMLENEDIISVVDKEVIDWARSSEQEITQLRKMEKYRKDYLGNVSHELKTPIFNIQGYILTLLDGGIEDRTINIKYLERTERSINRLISIVEDLEAISKLESGELELRYEDFDIVQMAEDVYEAQEIRAKKKNLNLTFGKNVDKPIIVNADKEQIYRALTNLIVNSIIYGKENGQTIIEFYDMDKNILVEVNDTGIGISEEHLPRLFERFYRIDKSRSREQGGTGLGLSIVKHIIEAHGQRINVRSEHGKGSSFAFTMRKGKMK